jgi:hypothetical protein
MPDQGKNKQMVFFSARSKLLWHFVILDSYAFSVVVLNHFGLLLDSNLFLKHFELF